MTPTEQSAQAPVQGLVEANIFTIEEPIAVSYSSTSISGQPLFSYRDVNHDLQFQGDEISRSESPVGEVVTVVLKQAVDAFTLSFTLLVPKIITAMEESVEFSTIGIRCVDTSQAFVEPSGRAGVKHAYQVYDLKGRAESVLSGPAMEIKSSKPVWHHDNANLEICTAVKIEFRPRL